jgi:serine/threonine protein kinase
MIGLGEKSHLLHLCDFGLSKRYKDKTTNKHIRCGSNKRHIGTARYSPQSSHRGIEQSRKDDLESIGYVLLYFQKKLPWQGINGANKKQKLVGLTSE